MGSIAKTRADDRYLNFGMNFFIDEYSCMLYWFKKILNRKYFNRFMDHNYSTRFVRKLTGASENQIKYWVKIRIVTPERIGKTHYYSFRDIIKLRVLVQLRRNGLSLQKVRTGIDNLSRILPDTQDPMTRLMIHTDGIDMIVIEKGNYYSAITRQQFFTFDTGQIESEMIKLQKAEYNYSKNENIGEREKEIHKIVKA